MKIWNFIKEALWLAVKNLMIGYKKTIDYLNRCIECNALSHAYIFYGPDESVKKEIALQFSDKILNKNLKFNPDLILISADNDEERSINLIRQLKKFLTLSPYYGKYKIAIIDAAEKLNIYAQNALLKIFEEAPNHAIIILNVKTISGVPETLASRGVKLPFWQQNNNESLVDEKIAEIFEEILSDSAKDRYYTIEKFNNYKAMEIFQLWLQFLRNKFLLNPTQKLNNLLKISQNIYFKLKETNINQKFAYDELILNLNSSIK